MNRWSSFCQILQSGSINQHQCLQTGSLVAVRLLLFHTSAVLPHYLKHPSEYQTITKSKIWKCHSNRFLFCFWIYKFGCVFVFDFVSWNTGTNMWMFNHAQFKKLSRLIYCKCNIPMYFFFKIVIWKLGKEPRSLVEAW